MPCIHSVLRGRRLGAATFSASARRGREIRAVLRLVLHPDHGGFHLCEGADTCSIAQALLEHHLVQPILRMQPSVRMSNSLWCTKAP